MGLLVSVSSNSVRFLALELSPIEIASLILLPLLFSSFPGDVSREAVKAKMGGKGGADSDQLVYHEEAFT